MAFMIGVRIISYGLAGGAAIIITTEAGRSAKNKLYQWAGELRSRSPFRSAAAAATATDDDQDANLKEGKAGVVEEEPDHCQQLVPFRSDPVTVHAVRSWCRKLLGVLRLFCEEAPDAVRSWCWELLCVVCDFYEGVMIAVERWGLGPGEWEKIRLILARILGLAVDFFVEELVRQNKGLSYSRLGQRAYYVLRREFVQW